jgi:hypothetical protein
MTTATQQPEPEEPFERVARQIDWVEQLENIRVRHDTLAAGRAAVAYVDNLHGAIRVLSGRQTYEDLQLLHGADLADLVTTIRNRDTDNDWTSTIQPGLLRED